MDNPVDLTNLRSMTDGDSDMEKALFAEFYESFEAGLASLRSRMSPEVNEIWRKEAHALKGIAVNLGAQRLGELCKKAQEEYQAGAEQKNGLLDAMQEQYAQVKTFLAKL